VLLVPIVLWSVACRGETSLIQVQDVDGESAREPVRIQGVVTRYPDYDPLTERLKFWLDDGTGTVLVILPPNESRALIDRGQVPTIGDRVSAEGTIRAETTKAWGDFVSFTVGEQAHLVVEASVPVESLIADAAASAAYSKVVVQGLVREIWQSYEGVTVLRVQDGSGEIDIVYGQDLVWISGKPTTVLPGDAISARGAVTTHDGRVQIVLDTASGLSRLPVPALQPTPLHATVVTLDPTATLDAGPISPTSTALASVRRPPPTISVSPTVMVTLAPDVHADSLRGSEADGASVTDGMQRLETGLLFEIDLGSSVTIEGRIERATLLSAGCKSVVNDGSGPAVVWVPNALYEQLVDPEGWNVGAVVRVTGQVSEYKGELEVVPQTPDAIVIVQRAFPAAAPDVVVGSLSVADLDRRVTVEGVVVALNPFSAGIKCVLDDGGGQVNLLLWQNVLEAFGDRKALAVGARIRASGWVQEYRGNLEVVPGLAHDVVVVEGAPGP
jgi:DNA/RNA endonuclease YhcR with UshA esterase domain